MAKHSSTNTRSQTRFEPVVFCDFDGTVTQLDVTDQILIRFAHPSWREVEEQWEYGLIGSRECLKRQIALVEASDEEVNALVDSVPLDPHLRRFQRFLRNHGIPFVLVSEGFDYVIRRVLKRLGVNGQVRNGSHFFASALRVAGRRLIPSFPHSHLRCAHGCATCKAAVIRRLSRSRHPIVFIGDGLSDRFAVEESDLIFAKGRLLAYCRERGVACRRFETFADVEVELAGVIKSSVSEDPSPVQTM